MVHYFTKYGSGECYFDFDDDSTDSDTSDEEKEFKPKGCVHQRISSMRRQSRLNQFNNATLVDDNYGEVIPLSVCTIPNFYEKSEDNSFRKIKKFLFKCCITTNSVDDSDISVTSNSPATTRIQWDSPSSTTSQNNQQARRFSMQSVNRQPSNPRRRKYFNSVSKIDQFSRVVFPLLFLCINLFYWYIYLSRSRRMSKQT